MDREELIEKAKDYENAYLDNLENGREWAAVMADFALEVIESQAVKFADNITANREAYRQGVQDGQRAERSRIAEKLDAMAMQNFNGSWAHVILNLVDELRADPAESGE